MKRPFMYRCVHFLLGLTCSMLLLIVLAAGQTQVTLQANKDNTLYEDAGGNLSNGAGENFFVGRTNLPNGSIRRGLISFNVAGTIPANATIQSATLQLNMSKSNAGGQVISVRRVLASWGEGTSVAGGNGGSGGPSTTNDATWIHRFFNSTLWATPGGDFSSTVSASQTVGPVGTFTWGSTAEMVSDVQLWLSTPSSNFGWVILGNESAGGTSKRFDSRENATVANRPKLTISYVIVNSVDETVPSTFALHQNHPNPFNPSTQIKFSVGSSDAGLVTLKVFDMLGREVATLINSTLPPGKYSTEWNPANIASGIYMYRMEAGTFSAARKMVISK